MHDSISAAIEKIAGEARENIPEVPADLTKTYKRAGGWGGLAAGAAAGAKIGGGLGIAAGPAGAIAGTIPGAVLGGLIGFFAGEKVGSNFIDEDE
jgi:phage tail tape-measure protein